MDNFDKQLSQLRDEIDDIDQQLVDLLVHRRSVTAKVGKLKSEVGKPIFDAQREAQLIDKRRGQASEAGVNPDLIEDLLRRIMRDSYQSQDESGYLCVSDTPKNVVVIGGKGQLGSIFVDLFVRTHYHVDIIEKDDWPTADAVLAKADLVIMSVPIRVTPETIQKLKHLPEHCILADMTSVKESPLYEMMKVHSGPVVGLHPMFGPDVTNLVKQTIITCEGRYPEKYQWLMDQLAVWGAKIHPVTAQAHDQAMSTVQVMRHFSTIAYGYHLMSEGANLQELVDMSSPIYRLEIMMVGRLFAQNPVLYSDIIFANPENISMMKRFAYRFLQLLEDVEQGDKNDFISMFNQVSQWFGDYADIFLTESKLMLLKANELKKD